jgi:ATP-dependent Clp protease adaptor protein ClpS
MGVRDERGEQTAVARKPSTDPARRGELETLEKPKVERPPLYEVLLHNDDYTTQEFVIYVLEKFFHHDAETARQIMLHVHTKGIGVAGVFPFDTAETKVHLVTEFSREHEMPLRCSLRKES